MKHTRDTARRPSRTRGLIASLAAVALGAAGLVAFATTASAAPANVNNPNHPAYWEAQYAAHSAVCYKHTGSSTHGSLVKDSDNKWSGVKLVAFNQSWPGDHWEALIVNGGPNGDNVIHHPIAGTTYYTPGTNPQGKRYDVSHWIVCKGTTPNVQVTPVAPVFTPPTCDGPGTLVGTDTAQYSWARTGPDSAAVLTATAIGNVTLTGKTVYGPYNLTQLSGEECLGEQPIEVTPAVFTAPTCEAGGTLTGDDTEFYTWVRTGPDTAAVLTATAIGEVTLSGQTVYGPFDLTQLTGEVCLSETPPIEEAPPVVTQNLAETGFPLLGVLGLAGSFSLIGGGLLNARRLLRKSA
jgi:hypothetical protein